MPPRMDRKLGAKEAAMRALREGRARGGPAAADLKKAVRAATAVADAGDQRRRERKALNKVRKGKQKPLGQMVDEVFARRGKGVGSSEPATRVQQDGVPALRLSRGSTRRGVIDKAGLERSTGFKPAFSPVATVGELKPDLSSRGRAGVSLQTASHPERSGPGRPKLGDGKAVPHSVGLPPALARLVEHEVARRGISQSEVLRLGLEIGLTQMASDTGAARGSATADLDDSVGFE